MIVPCSLTAFGRTDYDDVVITSIDVKKKPGTNKTVTFSGYGSINAVTKLPHSPIKLIKSMTRMRMVNVCSRQRPSLFLRRRRSSMKVEKEGTRGNLCSVSTDSQFNLAIT